MNLSIRKSSVNSMIWVERPWIWLTSGNWNVDSSTSTVSWNKKKIKRVYSRTIILLSRKYLVIVCLRGRTVSMTFERSRIWGIIIVSEKRLLNLHLVIWVIDYEFDDWLWEIELLILTQRNWSDSTKRELRPSIIWFCLLFKWSRKRNGCRHKKSRIWFEFKKLKLKRVF